MSTNEELRRCAEATASHPESEAEDVLAKGVLHLLADNESKRQACQAMGNIIKMYGDWVVEATDSQHLIGEDGDGDWELVWDRLTEMKLERAREKDKRRRQLIQELTYTSAIDRIIELEQL